MKPEQFETALKNGVIRKFDDLKSLADFYKLDYATLEKENEKFNGYMKAMKDQNSTACSSKMPSSTPKGPFYAIRLWPRVHHTMGGLEINEKAQVLDVKGQSDCRSVRSVAVPDPPLPRNRPQNPNLLTEETYTVPPESDAD